MSPKPQQEQLCLKWRFWWHFSFTWDCTLCWTNKAPKVQQPLMSATCALCTVYASGSEPPWEYTEVRDCKCFQDITMYFVCNTVVGTQLSHMRDYKYVHICVHNCSATEIERNCLPCQPFTNFLNIRNGEGNVNRLWFSLVMNFTGITIHCSIFFLSVFNTTNTLWWEQTYILHVIIYYTSVKFSPVQKY